MQSNTLPMAAGEWCVDHLLQLKWMNLSVMGSDITEMNPH